MFAGELAKPGGFCVGAFQGEEMLGYVIVAKYVDAWHIMNIAVDEPFRGRGVARALLEHLFVSTEADADRGYTLEVRVSNAVGDPPVRAARIRRHRRSPRLLHGQP